MGRGFVYRAGMMAAIGGFLFGYDLGVISGVLVTDSFNDFFQPMSSMKQGLIVSMLMLGCFVGSLISGVTTERIGRKFTIMAASLVFIVGAMLQCLASDIVMLYIGRLVGGLGVGHLSMTVPMYLSEISPPEVRGRLVSLQQMSVTLGVAISFWIDYACGQLPEELVWRVPLGIQALPAIVLLVGSLFLPYSPRWLMSKGREELAQKTLVKLRGGDVAEELAGIRESLQQTQSSYANLFRHPHSKRMVRGIGIQFMHQMSGIIAIIYYAPIIFQNSGLDGHRASLLAQGINGLVHVTCTIPAILYVDRWGRRPMLMAGALVMATSMGAVALLTGAFQISDHQHPVASYLTIMFIFIFVGAFSCTWGPVGWIYPSEIFPQPIRARAISITTATNLLMNYLVGLFMPILREKLGWIIYVFFSGVGLAMFATVYFFFPETRGRSIEDMDIVFGTKPANTYPTVEKLKD
ncbi:hypothetical protein DSO57_1036421 [Entomophthora muscae]|uniref:Uncharacterized protein n=1 Tax=Entomophthora muscae TaxID=34485 RepID=A0ACC2SNA8_9FUNG|nr:hypothetical protein DSO57_1036421 [Entomophthora muscae]